MGSHRPRVWTARPLVSILRSATKGPLGPAFGAVQQEHMSLLNEVGRLMSVFTVLKAFTRPTECLDTQGGLFLRGHPARITG